MSTSITICNMALAHLSITRRITAFSDATEEARNCAIFYDESRKHVLDSFPWNFACKFSTLALVADGDPKGFSYAYQLPSDCITARKIHNESFVLGEIDFKVAAQEIWTDLDDAELEYTSDIETVNFFSPTFITCFSHKLASDLAMPLRNDQKLQTKEVNAFLGYLSQAMTVNAREGLNTKEKTDDFLSARN